MSGPDSKEPGRFSFISTKSQGDVFEGKKGESKISYEGRVQFSKWVNKPDLLNTDEYGRAIWQAYANDDKLGEIKQTDQWRRLYFCRR